MKNGKQWVKSLIIFTIGALPLLLSTYTQANWYYVLISISLFFLVLGIIAMFQLLIYSILFQYQRNLWAKILFGFSIVATLTIPYFWIHYHESNPELLLENNYEIIDGTISNTVPKDGQFEIEYTFKIDSTIFKSSKKVKREPQSKTLNIKYLPSNPSINKPVEE